MNITAIKHIKIIDETGISEHKITDVGCCLIDLMSDKTFTALKAYISNVEALRPLRPTRPDNEEDYDLDDIEPQVTLKIRNTDRTDILSALRLWSEQLNPQSQEGAEELIKYIDRA